MAWTFGFQLFCLSESNFKVNCDLERRYERVIDLLIFCSQHNMIFIILQVYFPPKSAELYMFRNDGGPEIEVGRRFGIEGLCFKVLRNSTLVTKFYFVIS